jgi:stress-induced morphogen
MLKRISLCFFAVTNFLPKSLGYRSYPIVSLSGSSFKRFRYSSSLKKSTLPSLKMDLSSSSSSSLSVSDQIIFKCQESSLSPLLHYEIINDSSSHNVPKGSETHFKVILVSNSFKGMLLVQRHRLVYSLCKDLMRSGSPEDQTNYHKIHALSIIAKTEEEWEKENGSIDKSSPKCLGGMIKEREMRK